MAINKDRNIRFNITISIKQYKWLKDFSSKKHLRISQLISWLLAKKAKDVIDTLKLNTQPNEEIQKIEEESFDDEDFNEQLRELERRKKANKNVQLN